MYRKVAWIDADVYFEDDSWHINVSQALDSAAVVQPYSWSVRLPRGRDVYEGNGDGAPSFAYVSLNIENSEQLSYRDHGRTGFAWAGRRDWLEVAGLYDGCIVGGGDHLMAHIFASQFHSPCFGPAWGEGIMSSASRWAEMIHRKIPDFRLGVTQGRLFHFWHGEISNRRYATRRSLLTDHNFKPETDLRLSRSGAWEWASNKPDLHRGVREYFSQRAEDSSSSAIDDQAGPGIPEDYSDRHRLITSAGNKWRIEFGADGDTPRQEPWNARTVSQPGWVIYKWDGGGGFMLPTLISEASQISANPTDSVESVWSKIPAGSKVFAFHLDCTFTARFPLCRSHLLDHLRENELVILNEFVLDISKRNVTDMCRRLGVPCAAAEMDSRDSSELLIVKTNLNHLGVSEKRLMAVDQAAMGIKVHSPLDALREYQVICRRDVPSSWWNDPTLAIEKHISNSAGIKYRCYFAGDRCAMATIVGRERVLRYGNSNHLGMICTTFSSLNRMSERTLPTSLQNCVWRFVEESRADFGSLDIVMDEEYNAYIVDFNSTPFTPKRVLEPQVVTYLRAGLVNRAMALGDSA